MNKILSLIIALSFIGGLSAAPKKVTNLSNVFSKEIAEAKKLDKKVVMINSLEVRVAGGWKQNAMMVRSRALKSSILDSKEFKEFADNNASIHIVNIYPIVSYEQVLDIRKRGLDAVEVKRILIDKYGDGKLMPKWLQKVTDGNPRNGEITGRGVYADEARTYMWKDMKEKVSTVWRVFDGNCPASMLMDLEGNVLNMKLYGGSAEGNRRWGYFKGDPKEYINEYNEILKPKVESKKAK